MKLRTAFGCALVALVAASGCGGDSASDEAMADVCTARDEISRNVDELAALTLTSATTTQISENLQAIRNEVRKIADVRSKLSEERREDVQAANQAFTSSIRETAGAVGRTVSLGAARADAEAALDELKASYRSTFGALDCA